MKKQSNNLAKVSWQQFINQLRKKLKRKIGAIFVLPQISFIYWFQVSDNLLVFLGQGANLRSRTNQQSIN